MSRGREIIVGSFDARSNQDRQETFVLLQRANELDLILSWGGFRSWLLALKEIYFVIFSFLSCRSDKWKFENRFDSVFCFHVDKRNFNFVISRFLWTSEILEIDLIRFFFDSYILIHESKNRPVLNLPRLDCFLKRDLNFLIWKNFDFSWANQVWKHSTKEWRILGQIFNPFFSFKIILIRNTRVSHPGRG